MSLKKSDPIFKTVGISIASSLLFSTLFFFLYFYRIIPILKIDTTTTLDTHFAQYETIINELLTGIQKGEIEAAYNKTSPVFQKKTTLENFKKMMNELQSSQSIPSSPCTLTEYSEPFSATIEGLTDRYMIVQTKCETTENKEIKGFNVEFIEDEGKSKISFINPYKNLVVHKKNNNNP